MKQNNSTMGKHQENETHTSKTVSMPVKIPIAQKKCKHSSLNYEAPVQDVIRYELATLRMHERIMRHRMIHCTLCSGVPLRSIAFVDKMDDSDGQCKCTCQCKKRDQEQEDVHENIFPIDI